jgi:hypothetical protein
MYFHFCKTSLSTYVILSTKLAAIYRAGRGATAKIQSTLCLLVFFMLCRLLSFSTCRYSSALILKRTGKAAALPALL